MFVAMTTALLATTYQLSGWNVFTANLFTQAHCEVKSLSLLTFV